MRTALFTRDADCRTTIAALLAVIGPLDQWVACDHDALLAE
jgi:hypothetical protein